jgi:hypothetical protein
MIAPNMLWWCLFGILATAVEISKNYTSENGGSFVRQVGFCKAQSFNTVSRTTTDGPSLFTSARVWIGVGLSEEQFGGSIVSCGRCIEVLSIDRFYRFNWELTDWDYDKLVHGPFTAMVLDQCTDPLCTSGSPGAADGVRQPREPDLEVFTVPGVPRGGHD